MPELTEMAIVPIASAEAEKAAMTASFWFLCFELRMRREQTIATVMAIGVGARPRTIAIATAPKETWDSPSLIMDWLRSTRQTPSRAAQADMIAPATIARVRKSY